MTLPDFEWHWALIGGLPLAAALLASLVWRHRGEDRRQLTWLTLIRGLILLALLFLAARPIWSSNEGVTPPRHRVVLLVDRSESMSLEDEAGTTRYQAAVDFARQHLLPALHERELEAHGMLFSESAQDADGQAIVDAVADGKRTDLPRAIMQAVTETGETPLAVIALTDGVSTDDQHVTSATAALLSNGVPFVGIGFGSETGPKVLTLRQVLAPSRVAPNYEFRVEATLQVLGEGEFPAFEIVLLRDGKLLDQKQVAAASGARLWQESFRVSESEPGRHQYTIRVLPPDDPLIRCSSNEASALVTVSDEDRWRVLFVQGGLTWDFKFIQLAVRQDPALHMTGLSRTASESRFFQNVESETELLGGFPATMDQLEKFRVVVLANLKPADLGTAQQELLVEFCKKYGGGVLMMGGTETFNLAWRGSPLEQLLPVRFAVAPRGAAAAPFSIQISDEALRHPVFQISETGDARSAWARLPRFSEFAVVDSLKPGARVWMTQRGRGEDGTLMAVQQFGAGRTAALCLPNLWRWRLAKESDTSHFDRFWQQLLRYLGGGDVQAVSIHLADQLLVPDTDLVVTLQQRPSAQATQAPGGIYRFVVEDQQQKQISQQQVELTAGRSVDVTFRAPEAGMYGLRVLDANGTEQGSRTLEIKNFEHEFVRTERDMEHLRQWARLSGGLAVPSEDCQDARELVATIQQQAEEVYRQRPVRKPAGLNAPVMIVLLSLLAAEWLLRRRWQWT